MDKPYKYFRLQLGDFVYGYSLKQKVDNSWILVGYFNREKDAALYEKKFNNGNLEDCWRGLKAISELTPQLYCLQFEEEYEPDYYFVPTYDDFLKACLVVAQRRIKEGFWYLTENNIAAPKNPRFTPDEILDWEPGALKAAALKEWDSFERIKLENEKALDEIKLIEKVKQCDSFAACELLSSHRDREYEGISYIEMN